jgi:hypothetical protein
MVSTEGHRRGGEIEKLREAERIDAPGSAAARPLGVTLLSAFFLFGTSMALLSLVALSFPGTFLDAGWRLNPEARVGFQSMGDWSRLLMAAAALACFVAAIGLLRLAAWGRWMAVVILIANLLGDTLAAAIRHDPRTLIGIPIGGAMIFYLLSDRVRRAFASAPEPRVRR